MRKLRQFVPQEACRTCQGCCRYYQPDTVWAPLFLFEEVVDLTQRNIVPSCVFTHAGHQSGKAARINLVADRDIFLCPCLDPRVNICKIYADRPLDCRLYPFLLVRRGPAAYLAADEKCPYISEHLASKEGREYVAYLVKEMTDKDTLAFLRAHPEFVQAYPSDFRILEPLPEL